MQLERDAEVKQWGELRRRLSRVPAWVALAGAVTLGLLGYFGLLGVRYLEFSADVGTLTDEARLLNRGVGRVLPDDGVRVASVEDQEGRLERAREALQDGQSGWVVALVSDAAVEAGVRVASITLGVEELATHQGVRYQALPVTVLITGGPDRVSRFLAMFRQASSVMEPVGLRISGIDGTPVATVRLLFYSSPELTSGNGKG